MFPKMTVKKKQIENGLMDILASADWCTVAFNSPLGYPYQVAVNHVAVKDKIYFHSATKGFKLDCVAHDPRVCLKAVARETVVSQDYTTDYLSVVAFGNATVVEDADIKRDVLVKLMERFSPGHPKTNTCAHDGVMSTTIVEIEILHMTGKENKAL